MNIYKHSQEKEVIAKQLKQFKILFTKSGIFWGKRGDWELMTVSDGIIYTWICENNAFKVLYTPAYKE